MELLQAVPAGVGNLILGVVPSQKETALWLSSERVSILFFL